MTIRVGSGFDLHRLEQGHPFWLGGILVESPVGPLGHSDGDVVLHALCDALFGAMGLGDIGDWFPPSDPQWKGVASSLFVQKAVKSLHDKGFWVINADITVLLETPKLGPYKAQISQTVAQLLQITPDCVCTKAKTMEGLGAIGQGQAVAAMTTVLIEKRLIKPTALL